MCVVQGTLDCPPLQRGGRHQKNKSLMCDCAPVGTAALAHWIAQMMIMPVFRKFN